MTADAFFRLHGPGLPQQGPGSDATTRRALDLIRDRLPARPAVVDLGCGPGRQTLVLARELRTPIVAVDAHRPYLEELRSAAAAAGLADLVRMQWSSMDDLDVVVESLDLVWSEGALYTVGVRKQLQYLRWVLRRGGVVAFSEVVWRTGTPSEESREFWRAYPAMQTLEGNVDLIQSLSYDVIDSFPLPRSDWESYYGPLAARVEALRPEAERDPALRTVLEEAEAEMTLFERFGGVEYDYVFFLAAKNEASG